MAWHVGELPRAQEIECIICHDKFLVIPTGDGWDVCARCKTKLDPQTLGLHIKLCRLAWRVERVERLISRLKREVYGNHYRR